MYKEDLVSIVVPMYNAEKYIMEAVDCLLQQTYQNIEILIIDDGSTDHSMELVRQIEDKRVRLYQNEKNCGPAQTRNNGIKRAGGRYLAYMDADDLCSPDKIQKQIEFMKKSGCAFCFTGYEFANEKGERNGKIVSIPEKADYEYALRHTIISTITVMFDRNQIPDDILYMPLNARGEDTATWWQILRHGYIAYGINEPLSVYRRYGGTRSSNKIDAVYGTWKMYRQNEKLGLVKSFTCFISYIWNAIKRRI